MGKNYRDMQVRFHFDVKTTPDWHSKNTPIEHQVEVATNDRCNPNAREPETEIAAPLSLMIRFQMYVYLLTFVSLN
jgi:hypothetical protein